MVDRAPGARRRRHRRRRTKFPFAPAAGIRRARAVVGRRDGRSGRATCRDRRCLSGRWARAGPGHQGSGPRRQSRPHHTRPHRRQEHHRLGAAAVAARTVGRTEGSGTDRGGPRDRRYGRRAAVRCVHGLDLQRHEAANRGCTRRDRRATGTACGAGPRPPRRGRCDDGLRAHQAPHRAPRADSGGGGVSRHPPLPRRSVGDDRGVPPKRPRRGAHRVG